MSEKRINEELSAVEAALASLKPAASGVDRDRVMFLAGRMSAVANTLLHQKQKTPWLWPCVTAVSLLLAIASSGMLYMRGTAMGEKQAAYAKSNTIQTAENIPQPLWYEHANKERQDPKRQYSHSLPGGENMAAGYVSLDRFIAGKGNDAMPSPSWILIPKDILPSSRQFIQHDL